MEGENFIIDDLDDFEFGEYDKLNGIMSDIVKCFFLFLIVICWIVKRFVNKMVKIWKKKNGGVEEISNLLIKVDVVGSFCWVMCVF